MENFEEILADLWDCLWHQLSLIACVHKIIVTLSAIVLNVGLGEYPIPPLEILKTILGLQTANPDYFFIINTLRLPRTLVAFGARVGLAISGTLLQGLIPNPL